MLIVNKPLSLSLPFSLLSFKSEQERVAQWKGLTGVLAANFFLSHFLSHFCAFQQKRLGQFLAKSSCEDFFLRFLAGGRHQGSPRYSYNAGRAGLVDGAGFLVLETLGKTILNTR
jgi:hypothetical protein